MKKSHSELLQGLVSAGLRERYGKELEPKQINANTMVCSTAPVRMLLEMKQIEEAGFIDYYLMAFWIFNFQARAAGIEVWARGAVSSSVVCYCLGLTDVDPIKYGLHFARFVNEDLPKFQFDIEASRFDEFMKRAEEILAENAEDYDIPAIRECLFKDLKPSSYLSMKKERPLPADLEDEFARYALYFPQTMDLFCTYVNQYPNCDLLIYQEQMLDILREVFHVSGIKANHIRLSIQRGETEQIEAYKHEVFEASDLSTEEKEKAWQRLTSNPKAFLKAHAVSQVLASYKFDMGEGLIKKWKEIREYNEGLAGVKNADGRWGFIDKSGRLVIPYQWKKVLWFSEGLAGVQDDNEKWGFIDKTGKVVLPFEWSNVQWFKNGRVRVQTVLGGAWHDIDGEGACV
ncbi:MAG: WG repeat-containing protein [Bacteroidaceae bacterium]|nr:WG repeat-containing protein [Bacteroidaceae bacterium]